MDNVRDEAVVLLNMGGPNNIYEIEVFLRNMFNDPLILTIKNDFIRKMAANFITNARLERAKQNYKHLGFKSPLVEITFALIQKLQQADSTRFYTYAMRYTPPFADSVVRDLIEKNIKHITMFSMYPHYSTTTILSSMRDFLKAIKNANYNPSIKIIESYPTHGGFLRACVEQIQSKVHECNINPREFVLLLSAHAIPQMTSDSGDPYKQEIEESSIALKKELEKNNLCFNIVQTSYQSKLGPIKWLEPSTLSMIKKYKDRKIMIYPLAFTIDNSETDFELNIEDRKIAESLGVKEYVVCRCPNVSDTFVKTIIDLINSKGRSIHEARL